MADLKIEPCEACSADLVDAAEELAAPTLGSFCTGAGMLDLAVEDVLGRVRRVWHAENDEAASAVLAAHYPQVPNLGDLTAVDWTAVERPDVVTAGFPCTDVSAAGLRAGLTAGSRSGVWYAIARALAVLRPGLILIENVRGLLSARADCDLEPCPWCVGDLGDKPALRALGAVLGDLSDLGYDAEWLTVAAAHVGAPHRRERVFVIARPADADRSGWRARIDGVRAGQSDVARSRPPGTALLKTPTSQLAINGGSQHPDKRRAGGHGPTLADEVEHLLPTPKASDSRRNGSPGEQLRNSPGLTAIKALLPTPRATDGTKGGPNQRGSSGDLMLPSAVQLLPTPTTSNANGNKVNNQDALLLPGAIQAEHWGRYAGAVAHWGAVLGRSAPPPTEPGKNGPRLAAPFVEWMMGLEPGWVTGMVGRNHALRILGNGVVRQQAAYAYRQLLGGRLQYAAAIGCDSCDGTYLAFGPDRNLPTLLDWLDEADRQLPWGDVTVGPR